MVREDLHKLHDTLERVARSELAQTLARSPDFTPAQADALTDALRSAVEHGDYVASDQFRSTWGIEGARQDGLGGLLDGLGNGPTGRSRTGEAGRSVQVRGGVSF